MSAAASGAKQRASRVGQNATCPGATRLWCAAGLPSAFLRLFACRHGNLIDKALSWYGCGSPIGLSLGTGMLLLSACGSTYLLHLAGCDVAVEVGFVFRIS